MSRQGIFQEDLRRVTKEGMKKLVKEKYGHADEEAVNTYFEHFQDKRKKRIALILDVKAHRNYAGGLGIGLVFGLYFWVREE
jgi:hypothetical protein